jgi:glycosyltransferase involved in cell wall biosynthesis
MDADPFHPATWSGSSRHLFEALRTRGVLAGAVAAQTSRSTQFVHKVLAVQPSVTKWRFKYHLSLRHYRRMTAVARRALLAFTDASYDVILQVGAWYDLTGVTGKPVASYHDGNLATLLSSPYGHPQISRRVIERTLQYERELYGRIDVILPMSRWLADSFIRDNGVDPRKIVPVGAGVNLPRIQEVGSRDHREPRILFVGRDFERKGGKVLLEAFRQVRHAVPEAELTLIGPTLASAPAGVRCLGYLSKNSDGGLNQLLSEYARATVFVLPSLYEPYGIAFAEAMAHRLPCVGTNICAMPEIIEHGETGFVVPPGDANQLARSLIALLTDPEGARQMGQKGFEKYEREHTWETVAQRMCDAIGAVLR